jgi:hypothetical protein
LNKSQDVFELHSFDQYVSEAWNPV